MKRTAVAGFAAGAAMMIGGALAAVSGNAPSNLAAPHSEVMNPMIAGQAMLADRNLLDNVTASPDHTAFAAAMKTSGVAEAQISNGQFRRHMTEFLGSF